MRPEQWIPQLFLVLAVLAAARFVWGRGTRGRRCCWRCGYDMRGHAPEPATAPRCPECGWTAPSEAKFFRRQRRRRWLAAAAACLLAAYLAAASHRIRGRGWIGAIPTLILALTEPIYHPDEPRDDDSRFRDELWVRARQGELDGWTGRVWIESTRIRFYLAGRIGVPTDHARVLEQLDAAVINPPDGVLELPQAAARVCGDAGVPFDADAWRPLGLLHGSSQLAPFYDSSLHRGPHRASDLLDALGSDGIGTPVDDPMWWVQPAVAPRETSNSVRTIEVYDLLPHIRDLLPRPQDWEPPDAVRRRQAESNVCFHGAGPDPATFEEYYAAERDHLVFSLVSELSLRVAPTTWIDNGGRLVGLYTVGPRAVVLAPPHVHWKIRRYLAMRSSVQGGAREAYPPGRDTDARAAAEVAARISEHRAVSLDDWRGLAADLGLQFHDSRDYFESQIAVNEPRWNCTAGTLVLLPGSAVSVTQTPQFEGIYNVEDLLRRPPHEWDSQTRVYLLTQQIQAQAAAWFETEAPGSSLSELSSGSAGPEQGHYLWLRADASAHGVVLETLRRFRESDWRVEWRGTKKPE